MKTNKKEPKIVVNRLLVYLSALAIIIVILLQFLFFGPPREAFQLLLPSILASLVVLLAVYIFRQTLFKSTTSYLTEAEITEISFLIAEKLKQQLPSQRDLLLYNKWYDIPWQEVMGEAKELEFYVSYMDTWVNQTSDILQLIVERGGTIRVFLPKKGSEAAKRVRERFPEYSNELVAAKIQNTVDKLRAVLKRSHVRSGKLEVYCFRFQLIAKYRFNSMSVIGYDVG